MAENVFSHITCVTCDKLYADEITVVRHWTQATLLALGFVATSLPRSPPVIELLVTQTRATLQPAVRQAQPHRPALACTVTSPTHTPTHMQMHTHTLDEISSTFSYSKSYISAKLMTFLIRTLIHALFQYGPTFGVKH